jgi:hypothetical protein
VGRHRFECEGVGAAKEKIRRRVNGDRPEKSSFNGLYVEGHRVVSAGVRNDKLILLVLRRRDFYRTLRAGRVVLADFLARLVVDVQVHIGVIRTVRRGFELLPRCEGQGIGDLALVLHLDLLTLERSRVAQVGRLLGGTQRGERERNRCCGD